MPAGGHVEFLSFVHQREEVDLVVPQSCCQSTAALKDLQHNKSLFLWQSEVKRWALRAKTIVRKYQMVVYSHILVIKAAMQQKHKYYK